MPNFLRKKSPDRKAWHKLKGKYAKAIKAANVKFTDKLGPAIDKYAQLEAKNWKTEEQKSALVLDIAKQAKVVKTLASGYLPLVDKLADPAKKDLRKQLEAIISDAAFYDFMKV